VEINSCIEAANAARDFAAPIASAYRLSAKTTILDRNCGSSSLERLLKHKQRLRKSLTERGEPKATTAIHGPLGPVFYPNEKTNVIANYLENLFMLHKVTLTMNSGWKLESKLC
jgi:hypothetical protein